LRDLRRISVLTLGLLLSIAVSGFAAAGEPPRIGKPRPAPHGSAPLLPLPPAQFDSTLQISGQELKARKLDTRLSVDVRVNGSGPYHFIVDSGADTSVVGLRIARALELPLARPAILNGMTDRDIVDRVKVDALTVGSSTVGNLEVPALREVDVGGDGIIGIDALEQKRLMLDFEQRSITVEDARVPVHYDPGDIVIIARRSRGQLILTHVKAVGYDLDAVIDTGSQVTIGNLALRDQLIRGNHDKFTTLSVIGVTGKKVDVQVARIGVLMLGPVVLRDVPMAFADVPPFKMFGLSNQPALLLGTDILDTFRRVSLDFRSRKVRFQLRHCDATVSINLFPDTYSRLSSGDQTVCRR
jgi:hypothetical protein